MTLTASTFDRILSLDSDTAAFGQSLSEAFANTATVGKDESTMPMASKPTSGPKSDQNID